MMKKCVIHSSPCDLAGLRVRSLLRKHDKGTIVIPKKYLTSIYRRKKHGKQKVPVQWDKGGITLVDPRKLALEVSKETA